jgi:hypothetical protein
MLRKLFLLKQGPKKGELTEQQYALLCAGCDRILMASDSTDERVAIPWLHVIREHPAFLEKYKQAFEESQSIEKIKSYCLTNVRKIFYFSRLLKKTLLSGESNSFQREGLPDNIDFLFVSHLVSPAHAGNSIDFYFEDCAPKLVEHGFSTALVMLNHTSTRAKALASSWNSKEADGVFRFVLDDFIGLAEEVGIYRRMRGESKRLKQASRKEPDDFLRTLLQRASDEAMSPGTGTALRLAQQIGALVSQLKPKVVVLTHEGHAWERSVFASARVARPSAICVGYQHAAIFRLQHAIRRNLGQKYNPDHILVAGPVGKRQLTETGLRKPISVLGSNRAIDQTKLINTRNLDQPRRNATCLVLPEGIESECDILFEFSLQCAKFHPNITFIWRLHPIIKFNQLIKKNSVLKKLPENIILSNDTLSSDISRSTCALYRGSTAIIQAVSGGVMPIYLSKSNEMPVDPLYQLTDWKRTASSMSEFSSIVSAMDSSTDLEAYHSAVKYCRDYYTNFDLSQLTKFRDGRNTLTGYIG